MFLPQITNGGKKSSRIGSYFKCYYGPDSSRQLHQSVRCATGIRKKIYIYGSGELLKNLFILFLLKIECFWMKIRINYEKTKIEKLKKEQEYLIKKLNEK